MEVLAIAAVLVGAALQSATGFGFALVAAPALVAAYGPQASVTGIALLGSALACVILFGERRRPQPDLRAAGSLVLWALPGLPLGALVLSRAPAQALEAAVGVAVLAAVAVRAGASRRADPVPVRVGDGRTVAAGIACGALTTTTGINGPPLVLRLLASGVAPYVARDTLAVLFVTMGVGGVASLAVAGTFAAPPGLHWLVVATVVGQVAGRPVLERLDARGHERLVLGLLALAGAGALVSAFT